MRADIREHLHEAAAAELEHNGYYIALISKAIVDDTALAWSAPVCVRLVPNDDRPGMLEIEVREVVRRG